MIIFIPRAYVCTARHTAYVLLLRLPAIIVWLSIVPAGNQIAGSGVRWR
jgi:hypothetical protein